MPQLEGRLSFEFTILHAIWSQHGFCSSDRRHLAG